jgi:hypothetical protein
MKRLLVAFGVGAIMLVIGLWLGASQTSAQPDAAALAACQCPGGSIAVGPQGSHLSNCNCGTRQCIVLVGSGNTSGVVNATALQCF